MTDPDFPLQIESFETFDNQLQNIIQSYEDSADISSDPYIIHMLGVPGSGKTTFAQRLYYQLPAPQPTFLGFDRIMEAIPSYQAAKKRDIEEAFTEFELPARKAGYLILRRLIDLPTSVLLDHGGSAEEHPDILAYAKTHHRFRVYVVKIDVELATAKDRIEARSALTGRYTPLHYVDDRHLAIESLHNAYKDVSDTFFFIDNSACDNEEQLNEAALKIAAKIADDTGRRGTLRL